MLYWIIQITLISIILIFLIHHLINFFKSTLTVPKIKDLVNSPTQKYENMFNIIKNSNVNNNINNNINNDNFIQNNEEYTMIDLLPKPDEKTMKSELKNFLKKQLNPSKNIGTNISSFDSLLPSNAYSEYK
jgi:hypothetical protein